MWRVFSVSSPVVISRSLEPTHLDAADPAAEAGRQAVEQRLRGGEREHTGQLPARLRLARADDGVDLKLAGAGDQAVVDAGGVLHRAGDRDDDRGALVLREAHGPFADDDRTDALDQAGAVVACDQVVEQSALLAGDLVGVDAGVSRPGLPRGVAAATPSSAGRARGSSAPRPSRTACSGR